jgi:hypothetical protein
MFALLLYSRVAVTTAGAVETSEGFTATSDKAAILGHPSHTRVQAHLRRTVNQQAAEQSNAFGLRRRYPTPIVCRTPKLLNIGSAVSNCSIEPYLFSTRPIVWFERSSRSLGQFRILVVQVVVQDHVQK